MLASLLRPTLLAARPALRTQAPRAPARLQQLRTVVSKSGQAEEMSPQRASC